MAVENLIILKAIDFILKSISLKVDVTTPNDLIAGMTIAVMETSTLYITNITVREVTKNGIWIVCNGQINNFQTIRDPFFIPYYRIIKINSAIFIN
jgi:hypothetical protein